MALDARRPVLDTLGRVSSFVRPEVDWFVQRGLLRAARFFPREHASMPFTTAPRTKYTFHHLPSTRAKGTSRHRQLPAQQAQAAMAGGVF